MKGGRVENSEPDYILTVKDFWFVVSILAILAFGITLMVLASSIIEYR